MWTLGHRERHSTEGLHAMQSSPEHSEAVLCHQNHEREKRYNSEQSPSEFMATIGTYMEIHVHSTLA